MNERQPVSSRSAGSKEIPRTHGAELPNGDQANADGDSDGDLCDVCPLDPDDDDDGDGVCGDVDVCPGSTATDLAAGVPSRGLGTNRWAQMDGDIDFETVLPRGGGNGPGRAYTTEDTGGCTCAQIIATCGYGSGHTKFGCSISVMDTWTGLFGEAGEDPFQCE